MSSDVAGTPLVMIPVELMMPPVEAGTAREALS
jgi:hypothetical protein